MAEQSKALLISQLAQARRGLARNAAQLRDDFDVPQHIRSTFANHKSAWIGGAAALGWVLARLPGRRKKPAISENSHQANGAKVNRFAQFSLGGLLFALLRMAFTAAQPALTAIASRKIKDMAAERIRW